MKGGILFHSGKPMTAGGNEKVGAPYLLLVVYYIVYKEQGFDEGGNSRRFKLPRHPLAIRARAGDEDQGAHVQMNPGPALSSRAFPASSPSAPA